MIAPRDALAERAVAAHYDDLDPFYREIWGEHVHHGYWKEGDETPERAARRLIELVADRAEIAPGESVCDVGCGYGGAARVLASEYGAVVTALTISPAQHQFACDLDPVATNLKYLLADWLRNDLPSASFNVVISIERSEHMVDKPAFFAEVHRVLKPGGRFVVCAWLAKEEPKAWEHRHLLEPICREGRLPSMGSAREYTQFAQNAGLEPQGFDDLSRQVKRTWPICAGRVIKGLFLKREYRDFLFRSKSPDRIFALTLFRIWMAYETGAMRYGVMTARKPADVQSDHSDAACFDESLGVATSLAPTEGAIR